MYNIHMSKIEPWDAPVGEPGAGVCRPTSPCDHCRSKWGRPAGEQDIKHRADLREIQTIVRRAFFPMARAIIKPYATMYPSPERRRTAEGLKYVVGRSFWWVVPDFYGPSSLDDAERIHREVFARRAAPHDPLGPVASDSYWESLP